MNARARAARRNGSRTRVFLVAGLFVLISGCAAKTNERPEKVLGGEAQKASGALAGIVFDSELVPISGVEVALEGGQIMTTREDGAFAFEAVPPGSYQLHFRITGFEPISRRVDVVADELTEIRVEMKATATDAVYHWSFSRVGMVRVGQWSVQYAQHLVNQTAVDAILCDPCAYAVTLQPLIVDAMTEVQFSRAVSAPMVNEYVTAAYSVAQTTGGALKLLMTHDFAPRESYLWSTVQVRELRGYERVRLEFHGPDLERPGVLVNQKVELWQTFAHGQLLPRDYTLLPS